MAVRGKLNIRQLLKKNINKSKVFQNLAYGAAKKKIEGLKKETLREFNQHLVTKELEKGTSGMNSSLLGGRGNFFGFLGFHDLLYILLYFNMQQIFTKIVFKSSLISIQTN